MTALMGNLELLKLEPELYGSQKRIIEKCLNFIKEMNGILYKFQIIKEYRTTPYVKDTHIIDIDG